MYVFDRLGLPSPKPKREDNTLEKNEVRRWLMMAHNDFWYKSQMPVSIRCISNICGTHYENVYKYIIAQRLSGMFTATTQRIAKVIPSIENRQVILLPKYKFVWLTPTESRPRINKMSELSEWSLFAECQSCGSKQFLPAIVNGKEYAICYACIPPSQYKSIGAILIPRKSLIKEAMIQMGHL